MKVNWDILLSTSAFKINLRCYIVVPPPPVPTQPGALAASPDMGQSRANLTHHYVGAGHGPALINALSGKVRR